MIKVLGRDNSVNVQKVMWCAAELGVDVAREDVGGAFGGNDTDVFLALNPNGSVPVLVDGDLILWESNTIVRYLCNQYATGPWVLPTAQQTGLAEQWMDWYIGTLNASMKVLFVQLIRTDAAKRDKQQINKAIADATRLWSILDQHLANRDFILGQSLSMADIPLGCAAYRWHSMEFERPDLLNLKAWWDRLVERRTYRKNVMIPLT